MENRQSKMTFKFLRKMGLHRRKARQVTRYILRLSRDLATLNISDCNVLYKLENWL